MIDRLIDGLLGVLLIAAFALGLLLIAATALMLVLFCVELWRFVL